LTYCFMENKNSEARRPCLQPLPDVPCPRRLQGQRHLRPHLQGTA
jgi:hypothetical protein